MVLRVVVCFVVLEVVCRAWCLHVSRRNSLATLVVVAYIYDIEQRSITSIEVDNHHVKSRRLARTVVASRPCEAVVGKSATVPAPCVHSMPAVLSDATTVVNQARKVNPIRAYGRP